MKDDKLKKVRVGVLLGIGMFWLIAVILSAVFHDESDSDKESGVAPVEKPMRLMLNEGYESKAIRVTRSQCIRWWSDDPDDNAFTVLVKGVNHNKWYAWETFQNMKRDGVAPFNIPGWFKFLSNVDQAPINYIKRRKGQCT